MVWRLVDREPLSKWVHEDGKIALMGDACHPMLVSVSAYASERELRHDYTAVSSPRGSHGCK